MMSPIQIPLVAVEEIRLALKGIGPVSLIPIPVFHQQKQKEQRVKHIEPHQKQLLLLLAVNTLMADCPFRGTAFREHKRPQRHRIITTKRDNPVPNYNHTSKS